MMLERAGLECQRLRQSARATKGYTFSACQRLFKVVSSSDDGDEAADGGPVVDLVSCSDDGEEVADGRPEAPSSSSAGPGRETPGQVQLGASADDAEEVASDDSEAMLQQAMRDIPRKISWCADKKLWRLQFTEDGERITYKFRPANQDVGGSSARQKLHALTRAVALLDTTRHSGRIKDSELGASAARPPPHSRSSVKGVYFHRAKQRWTWSVTHPLTDISVTRSRSHPQLNLRPKRFLQASDERCHHQIFRKGTSRAGLIVAKSLLIGHQLLMEAHALLELPRCQLPDNGQASGSLTWLHFPLQKSQSFVTSLLLL